MPLAALAMGMFVATVPLVVFDVAGGYGTKTGEFLIVTIQVPLVELTIHHLPRVFMYKLVWPTVIGLPSWNRRTHGSGPRSPNCGAWSRN